jgi:hypothetical protein
MRQDVLFDMYDVGCDVMGTAIADNGTISAQVGDVVTDSVTGAKSEWWQHVGFASRPAVADAGEAACQAVKLNRGDRDVVIATRDLRGQTIYGNLKDGETCVYAPGAQGRVSFKSDGSVTLYTTDDNTENGNGVYLKLAKDRLEFMSPWGKIIFDATGIHLLHTSGFRWDAGSCSVPGPLADVLPNYCRFETASFSVDAPLVMLGPSDGVFGAAVNTVTPVPLTPVLCGAPGSPTAPPLTGSAGVFVSVG